MVQQFSQSQLLTLLLPLCRARAERFDFSNEAAEILNIMEESTNATPLPEFVSSRELRNLRKTLSRMNFATLIGLLTHQSTSQPGDHLLARLVDTMEDLRQQLAVWEVSP